MKTTRTGSNEALNRLFQQLTDRRFPSGAPAASRRRVARAADAFEAGPRPAAARQAARQNAPAASTPVAGAPAASAPAPGPALSVPSTNSQYDGGVAYDPEVESLQRTLVELGYMTQAEMDTGPGHFGPRTRRALARLQAENGLAGDGSHFDDQTRTALTQTVLNRGGSVAAPGTASRLRAPSPTALPPSADGGLRRWDVPYINQMHSEGSADDWNASSNCGPTTMAMIAKGLGYGRSMVDGDLVNQLARSEGVGASGAGYDTIAAMARDIGLSSSVKNTPTAAWVQQQLEDGKLIAANGDRGVTLRNEQPPYASGQLTGGHWIAVVGMTQDGNFLVQDPSTTCKVLSPAQLEAFFRAHGDGGWAVAIGNGQ